ncbi:low temperature requirement protein A [Actinoplanes sp. URMC 104]|uniref:low temperature requirement protein A n=1 Tax=Actinoplanes sp. URMC 104 TaxID=3423409 RepID=UPI003F1D575D
MRTERTTEPEPSRRWLTPMRARPTDEPHRVATPLELFFDLCFVVAVSQAAVPLHHAVAEGHVLVAVRGFLMVFFAIWWAWMNFTWFASAYDTDDDVYRITTLVQIAGALVLAAGVEAASDHSDFTLITIGYVVMRLALVAQWLRAARSDPQRRDTAIRYAVGVTSVQVLWLLRLLLPAESAATVPVFVALALLEIAVPVWAERAPGGPTTYHPHHIAERYGLFTLIVLGESVLAATVAFQDASAERGLVALAISGIVIVFALWWIYFDRSAHRLLSSLRTSILWGYGHYFIFASAAAVGAGLAVGVDHVTHHAEVSATLAAYAIAVPVACYLFFVWLLHLRPHQSGALLAVYPVAVVLILLTPLLPAAVEVIAAVLVVLVVINAKAGRRRRDPGGQSGVIA